MCVPFRLSFQDSQLAEAPREDSQAAEAVRDSRWPIGALSPDQSAMNHYEYSVDVVDSGYTIL